MRAVKRRNTSSGIEIAVFTVSSMTGLYRHPKEERCRRASLEDAAR